MRSITGMMIYYYMVCKRKLWYFGNEIVMEQNSEYVDVGKVLDEMAYSREDKHIQIDDAINIDFISSDMKLHEIKKSRKIEEASIMQMKYYLYYLRQKGVEGLRGEIDFPTQKQKISVELTDKDIEEIDNMSDKIRAVLELSLPPQKNKKSFCRSCAYFDLCYM